MNPSSLSLCDVQPDDRDDDCNEIGYGQLYTRGVQFEEYFAIMYMWYFPKDVGTGGANLFGKNVLFNPFKGTTFSHSHDFESVIVWATSYDSATALVRAVSFSGHGEYKSYAMHASSGGLVDGTHPKTTYSYREKYSNTHELDKGGESDYAPVSLIQYENLPEVSRVALEKARFVNAICHICTHHSDSPTFDEMLHRAYDSLPREPSV